eukprot:755863-Hanusia_phi.AAC.2
MVPCKPADNLFLASVRIPLRLRGGCMGWLLPQRFRDQTIVRTFVSTGAGETNLRPEDESTKENSSLRPQVWMTIPSSYLNSLLDVSSRSGLELPSACIALFAPLAQLG